MEIIRFHLYRNLYYNRRRYDDNVINFSGGFLK